MIGRRPRVRALEPVWAEQDGERLLVLRDRTGVLAEPVAVPAVIGLILSLCDGVHDEEAIRAVLERETGQQIATSQLASLLDQLETACILEGDAAARAMTAAIESFRSAPHRPALLADAIYPADPATLVKTLAEYGKGEREEPSRFDVDIRGVISPHIDYERGGRIYHRVWHRAAPALREADVVLIFGTDHAGSSGAITLTRQGYATPFGTLATDTAIVDAIAEAVGDEAFAEELHHRGEHSIELAAVWAASLLDGRTPSVVPILCGSFQQFTHGQDDPAHFARYAATIDAIKQATHGKRVLAVAAADLAHVGPAFGDPAGLDQSAKERLRVADEALLTSIGWGRAAEFVERLKSERDARKVCGLPPIYLLLRMLEDARAEVVGYEQTPASPNGDSVVSIAGALLW